MILKGNKIFAKIPEDSDAEALWILTHRYVHA
jgi:hypothetical protein